jgi:hypothetical protein
MSRRVRNPLEPFASTVSALVMLLAGLFLLTLGSLFHPGHMRLWGIGESPLCAFDRGFTARSSGGDLSQIAKAHVFEADSGTTLCVNHPTAWQQTLNALTQAPTFIVTTVALILLWRLIQCARRNGPFATQTSRRLRFIGWWLLGGGLIGDNLQQLANIRLLQSMLTPDYAPAWILPTVPWSLMITGLGMLTVARILSAGLIMREQLEATI